MKIRAVAAFAAGMGMICALAAAAHADEKKVCRYLLASLPLSFDNGMRPTIPAKVNGTDVSLLVDTGAIDSELAWNTVQRLKMPKTMLDPEARVFNVAGGAVIYRTTADTFSIGAMSATNWPFLVAPEHDPGIGNGEVDGILGPDVMVKYDVEFDFAAGKFNIFTHDECTGRVVYWTQQSFAAIPLRMDGYHIYAPATLDGYSVDVMIDSGASVSNTTSSSADEMGLAAAQMTRINGGKDPKNAVYTYPFHSLDLGGLVVTDPQVIIIPERNGALHNMQEPKPVIVLGDTVLRRLHIYIAYRQKVLYLTTADAR
ncbi:MAG: aspartyl protease family protein [Alphaproteobacteria bacterium]|nr:aspartyl protease family protein [Alphaproteobacteria bacterium]